MSDHIATNLNSNSLQEYVDLINASNEEKIVPGDYNDNNDYNNNQSEGSLVSVESTTADGYDDSVWSIVYSSAINLVLPFINGLMLGFGEIVAHEIGFRYGWYGAKVQPQKRLLEGRLKIQQEQQEQQQRKEEQKGLQLLGSNTSNINGNKVGSRWL